ncbi:hypothetical protein SAMN05428953_101543 [Mesorhizobium muleiense]|uniref:DUF6471 domain-containing protein n=2 Tax=Mesorhizobium muleiense TaxID=1004279 RepID=A0A1G8J1I7_9HYPH|nr:hypothetical protein SAMN05428953_101543 [Mesorhizobium muleiense]
MMSDDVSPTAFYEEKAKNILKGELKRRGITYALLAERLNERGAHESERNLANKISRGSFTAAFFMMCMDVIGVRQVSLEV